MRIEIVIPTKDRYESLAMLLVSISEQTYKDFCITIVDDGNTPVDIRTLPYLFPLLTRLDNEGHSWRVLYGDHKGPHYSVQKAFNDPRCSHLMLVDDDETFDTRCLEYLVEAWKEKDGTLSHNEKGEASVIKVGAIGPVVLNPQTPPEHQYLPVGYRQFKRFKGRIDKYGTCTGDHHWRRHPDNELQETTHLQAFIVSMDAVKDVGGFDLNYNITAFRTETDFCYSLFKKGYKMYVQPKAIVWHFQSPTGGIRSEKPSMHLYEEANEYYLKKFGFLRGKNETKVIKIYGGMGDHLCATPLIRALKRKGGDVTLSAVYPLLYIGNPNVDELVFSQEDGAYLNVDMRNVFEWAYRNQFWGSIPEAFCRTYSEEYDGDKLDYYIQPEEREWVDSLGIDKPFIIIAPWGAHPPIQYDGTLKTGEAGKMTVIRDWFKDRYMKLVKEIQELGIQVFQVGGATEEKIEICDRHFQGEEQRKVIALLEKAETFIGVDSFLQHAAHAIGKRGVVLFGPSDPVVSGHASHINIKTYRCDQAYACHFHKTPKDQWTFKAKDCKSRICMKGIKVKTVLDSVKLLLKDKKM